MAKTMRNVVITCILLIALAAGASALVMTGGCSSLGANPLSGFLSGSLASTQTDAVNTLIETSGIKQRIESELHAHVQEVSAQTGVPAEVLEYGIETLDIQNWQATDKPDENQASATGTYSVDAEGTMVDITTYDDPSVVTVQAYGQEVTLSVPESAQQYAYLLPMLEYV